MPREPATARYIADGTFSLEETGETLSHAGVYLEGPSGEAKFVPDDPSFPTTFLLPDGTVEVEVDSVDPKALAEYVERLSSWLGVALQRIGK